MLVPAILYKDEITKEFQKKYYTDEMFYYVGYEHSLVPDLDNQSEGYYQWAILGKGPQIGSTIDILNNEASPLYKEQLIGYFAYHVSKDTDCADRFGLISFVDEESLCPIVGHDVFSKMEELVQNHHRVSWRCISGNPACDAYRRFTTKLHNKHENLSAKEYVLRDVTKDPKGNYRNEHIFEIINSQK